MDLNCNYASSGLFCSVRNICSIGLSNSLMPRKSEARLSWLWSGWTCSNWQPPLRSTPQTYLSTSLGPSEWAKPTMWAPSEEASMKTPMRQTKLLKIPSFVNQQRKIMEERAQLDLTCRRCKSSLRLCCLTVFEFSKVSIWTWPAFL